LAAVTFADALDGAGRRTERGDRLAGLDDQSLVLAPETLGLFVLQALRIGIEAAPQHLVRGAELVRNQRLGQQALANQRLVEHGTELLLVEQPFPSPAP
jgi:hypothetical protein